MKIKELQILNFKSYFGRQIIGPFNDHFTCIIGPNGNGKSNILDAMLFVFGFKSSKLRQDSLASLIHSSAFGQPEQAKVTVKFIQTKTQHKNSSNHPRKVQTLSTTQSINVSRTVRKNGYSFYQLNDKKIQWQELKEFLMKKDIDLEKNLFIILQGQVERLCELSPQKLVEYMEYVSGSDQYLPKITQLQQEYVLEGVKCEQAKQKYQISKKIFTQQQKQTFQLLEHIGLRIKLIELSFLHTKKCQQINLKNLKKHKEKLQKISEQIKKIDSTLQSLLGSKEAFDKTLAENNNQMSDMEKEISQIMKEITSLELVQKKKKQTELEFMIKDFEQKQKQTAMVEKEKKELSKITQNENELREQCNQMEDMIMKVIEKIQKCQYKQGQNSVNQAMAASNKKSSNKGPTTSKPYQQLKQICKLKQQVQSLKILISSQLSKQLQQTQTKLKQLQSKHQQVIQKYGKNGQKFTSNDEIVTKLKLRIRNFTQAIQQKEKQLSISISNLDEIKRRIKDCESTKSMLTNHQKVVNQIKTANRVKILLPHKQLTTLRQQVLLPPNQAHLISAITPQLDFVIVQNDEQARQIIQFLTARKIGRMSFILKDEVNKLMNGVNTEWNRGTISKACSRIYDIARPIDKEYQKIWFWSVGNTLIADTLDEAMKVAYYESSHYRVITRIGEFIDMSGAMTKLPIMGRNLDSEDRNLLETRLKVLQNKIDEDSRKVMIAKKEKQQMLQELNNLSSSMQQFSTLQQIKGYILSVENQLNALQRQVMNIQGQMANHELSIRLKCKEVEDMIKEMNIDMSSTMITFDQLVELVDQYEKLMGKIKKISISQQLIRVHQEKLKKYRQEMYLVDQKIFTQKNDIQLLISSVKEKKQQITKIQQRKRHIRNSSSQIQQKLFLLDLDIKQLKGQLQTKNHHQSQSQASQSNKIPNNKQNKKQKTNIHKIHNLNTTQSRSKSASRSHIQSLLSQKPSLPQLIKQQKMLSQEIKESGKQMKWLNHMHDSLLSALSRLFSFLVQKCSEVQVEGQQQEKQQVHQEQQENKKTDVNIDEETFQQLLQRKHKKIVTFKDILFEYFQAHNLVTTLQKNITPKQHSSKSKTFSTLLTNLCQHYLNNNLAPLSKIISMCYFNDWKIMNISPDDQYFFVNFLAQKEIQRLVKNVNPNEKEQQNISQQKNLQDNEQVNQAKQQQGQQRLDIFILQHLTIERIKFLYKLYDQKLQSLSKNSRSIFMNSGKKTNPHLGTQITSTSKRLQQHTTNPIDPQDPTTNKPLSYFTTPQSPLNPNEIQTIIEYQQHKQHFSQLQSYLQYIQGNIQFIYKQLLCLRQSRNTCFLNTFNLINIQVNKIYHFLTKGNAEINLVNSINPLEGLEFSVRPFNKSWKSVHLLSGGQKTLTSLSLIFACQQVRKFPFYFMDEIDAALDYKNVTNLGKYIKEKHQVQHIVISLRKNMYQQCDSLVCIYKVNDVSRTMKVDMKDLYSHERKANETKKKIKIEKENEPHTQQKDDNSHKHPIQIKNPQVNNFEASQTSTLTMLSK